MPIGGPVSKPIDSEKLSRAGLKRIGEDVGTWEAYVLGRMGLARARPLRGIDVADPGWPEGLDGFVPSTLDEVLDVVVLLGRLAIGGWSRTAPDVGSGKVPSREVIEAGFGCVSGGQVEVDRLVGRVVASAPTDVFGFEDLIGWVTHWLQADDRRRAGLVMRAIVRAIRDDGRFASTFSDLFPDVQGRGVSATDVSRTLDVSRSTSRRILAQAGLLQVSKHAGRERIRRRVGDADDVAALVVDLRTNLLSKDEASKRLGVDPDAVTKLVAAGHLVGTSRRWSADGQRAPTVRRESVEALLDATVSQVGISDRKGLMPLLDAASSVNADIAEVISGIVSGSIKVAGRLPDRQGLSSLLASSLSVPLDHPLMLSLRHPQRTRVEDLGGGVTRTEAANALGVPPGTVAALVRAGHLVPVPGTKEGQRQPITTESLRRVDDEFVTAAACAKEFGFEGSPSALSLLLRKADVPDVLDQVRRDMGGKVTAFYPREMASMAVTRHVSSDRAGTTSTKAQGRVMADFWQGFDEFLRSARSSFRVRSSDGRSARLRTNCSRWRSELIFDDENVLRCCVVLTEHDARGRGRAASKVWTDHYGQGDHLHRPPTRGDHGSVSFEVGPVASLSGRDEVIFGTFRNFLYRQMLLGVEEGRIFFEHAENGLPGGRPFVMF